MYTASGPPTLSPFLCLPYNNKMIIRVLYALITAPQAACVASRSIRTGNNIHQFHATIDHHPRPGPHFKHNSDVRPTGLGGLPSTYTMIRRWLDHVQVIREYSYVSMKFIRIFDH